MNLLKKYPILEPTAFVLIGYVGILIVEETYHLITGAPIHLPVYAKFVGILMIIWVALFYEADGAVRRLVKPIVNLSIPRHAGGHAHGRHHPVAARAADGAGLGAVAFAGRESDRRKESGRMSHHG